jgi:hypothetical protein
VNDVIKEADAVYCRLYCKGESLSHVIKIQDVDGFDLDPNYKLSQLEIQNNCELIAIPQSCDVESSLPVSEPGCNFCKLKTDQGRYSCSQSSTHDVVSEGVDIRGVNKTEDGIPIFADRNLLLPMSTERLKKKSNCRFRRLLHLGQGCFVGKSQKLLKCFRSRTHATSHPYQFSKRRKKYIQHMISRYRLESDLNAREMGHTGCGILRISPHHEKDNPILDYSDETTKLTVSIPLDNALYKRKSEMAVGKDSDRCGNRKTNLLDVEGGCNGKSLVKPTNTTEHIGSENLNEVCDSREVNIPDVEGVNDNILMELKNTTEHASWETLNASAVSACHTQEDVQLEDVVDETSEVAVMFDVFGVWFSTWKCSVRANG